LAKIVRSGFLVLVALLAPLPVEALSLVMFVRSDVRIVDGQAVDAFGADGATGTVEINVDHISISGGQCRPIFCGPDSILVEGFDLDLGAESATIRLGDDFIRTIPIRSYIPFITSGQLQLQTVAFRIETPTVPPVPAGPDYLYRQDLNVTIPTFGNFTTEWALETVRSGVVGRSIFLNSNVNEFDHDVVYPFYLFVESGTIVPEPGTALLFGLGLAILARRGSRHGPDRAK
jgi:hypothetical protein